MDISPLFGKALERAREIAVIEDLIPRQIGDIGLGESECVEVVGSLAGPDFSAAGRFVTPAAHPSCVDHAARFLDHPVPFLSDASKNSNPWRITLGG